MRTFLPMAANRSVDDYAINICGVSGSTLMKNAGVAVIEQMEVNGLLKNSPQILVMSGKGNNGGDGYVTATELHALGLSVSVITTANEAQITGDALTHYQALQEINLPAEVWANTPEQLTQLVDADIIIDALLGTGISGEIRAPYAEIIVACNQSQALIVAVDVPSGVTGDVGSILEPCISATLTVSMGFGKQSCLFEPARSKCGKIIPVDIGFPTDSLLHVDGSILHELELADFSPAQYTRSSDAHKYSTGKTYIIAGSKGFSGAALLSSKAALRSGAGLVKLALPQSLGQIGETLSLETIIEYLPETEEQSFALNGQSKLLSGCEWADTVAIGPGLGRNIETMELVRKLIPRINRPLVIDADALFALIGHCDILKERTGPAILTPHVGEFKRLLNLEELPVPNWQSATEFAKEYGVFVLLKGAPSILATPDGEIMINSTGYAGMATAGSGDVLTGVIASLWAQWGNIPEVLTFAMYMHGHAADLKYNEKGILGLIASDIIEALPEALKEYGGLPD